MALAGALASTCLLTGGAHAESGTTAAPAADWRDYVLGPDTNRVKPVGVSVLGGTITNAEALAPGGTGTTTLTMAAGGTPASVLLDYGQEVSGSPYVGVKSSAIPGASPSFKVAFSETKNNFDGIGLSKPAVAAAAGDTTIKLLSAATFNVGDPILFAPPSTAGSATIASISGNVITLTAPLAGTASTSGYVVSTASRLTGDSSNPAGYDRVQALTPSTGEVTGSFQGGQRYEIITLTQPGTLELSRAGINFQAYRATADDYQGNFLSSSDTLNKLWYSGAYTAQTNMQPAGVSASPATASDEPMLFDGAKRDRSVWSGDLAVQGPVIQNSLGSAGNEYVKQSLLRLIETSPLTGGLNAQTLGGAENPYSNSYSSWVIEAATEYVQNTGDLDFARTVLPYFEGQLDYNKTLENEAGLISVSGGINTKDGSYDWDFYDGQKNGVVAAFNMLYYRAVVDVAQLQTILGDAASAKENTTKAAALKTAINSTFFDTTDGVYAISDTQQTSYGQDANSLAIVFGIAPEDKVDGILAKLKTLWGDFGSAPFSTDTTYSKLISPFITNFEVEALYQAGDTADAEELLQRTWGPMVDTSNANYTGTYWENITPTGGVDASGTSLSHGWSAGPTALLSDYVLGIQPLTPGYATFSVKPQFGSLGWAQGTVPTSHGSINVAWKKLANSEYQVTIKVPANTTGVVTLNGLGTVSVVGGQSGVERTFTTGKQPTTTVPTPVAKEHAKITFSHNTHRVKVKTTKTLRITITAPSAKPTGTVTVRILGRGKVTKTLNASGIVKIKLPKWKRPGTKIIRVTYSGDANVTAITTTNKVKVTRR